MKEIYIKKESLGEIIGEYFIKDLISIEELIGLLEELDYRIKLLEEKIEDTKEYYEENYRQVSTSSQVGIKDSDFI